MKPNKPKKLFDRLTLTNQNRLLRSKELWITDMLKESTSFYLLSLLDAVFVWFVLIPDKDFHYENFKKMFQ